MKFKNIQFTITFHRYEGFNTFANCEDGYNTNDELVEHIHYYGITCGALTPEITVVYEKDETL